MNNKPNTPKLKLYVDGKLIANDIQGGFTILPAPDPYDAEVVSYDGDTLIIKNYCRSFEFNPVAYPGMKEKLSGLKPGDKLRLRFTNETP